MCFIIKLTIVTYIFVILKTDVVITANCSTIPSDVPTFRYCQYRCHCKNDVQCAEYTGTCENGCAFGWMGRACQYRNIAKYYNDIGLYVNNTEQSAMGNEAVDGDSKTCTQTNITVGSGQQYWYLQFNRTYEVVGLIIKVPDDDVDNFRHFWIETGDRLDETDFPTLCYHQTNKPIYPVIEIMCLQPTTVQQLRIRVNITDAPLGLCEVEIYGGRSIAFNKPTRQNTIRYSRHSYRAVDGTDNRCTDKESTVDPWWRVNLETQYVLHEVHFDAYMYTMRGGFCLLLGSNETSFIELYRSTEIYNLLVIQTVQIQPPAAGQYLQAQLQYRFTTMLSICEIVVFGECPRNKCGLDCSQKCFCTTDITGTHQQEGQCPYGCHGRWTGVDGKCDHECQLSEWGTQCENRCGHCEGSPTCNVTSGECANGCSGQWVPPMCTEFCPDFKYGLNCASDCGMCQQNIPCNVTDGTCVDGCQPDWKPPTCHELLPDFKNRFNAALNCGMCKNNSLCNITDGTCVDGNQQEIVPSCYSVGMVAGVVASCGAVIVGLMMIIIVLVYRQHASFRREQRLCVRYTPGNSCGETDGQVAGRIPGDVQTDRQCVVLG